MKSQIKISLLGKMACFSLLTSDLRPFPFPDESALSFVFPFCPSKLLNWEDDSISDLKSIYNHVFH